MLTENDISQDFSLQIGTYFLLVPKIKIYARCKLVDESDNEIPWLSGFILTENNCSFSVDKSK
jgi:hypothetical protein